jgi:histidinol-phosphatase (PHP family)
LAGLRKGCGIYPDLQILQRAKQLDIPISIGADGHSLRDLGINYQEGINYALEAGYKHYVSYTRCIPEMRPLENHRDNNQNYEVLNLGIEMLNRRFENEKQRRIPKFSFGGSFRSFSENFRTATSLGDYEAIRIRKGTKSITIGKQIPQTSGAKVKGLFSRHIDKPGILSILFNTLASEEINVETAYLNSNEDNTATAFLTLSGEDEKIREAVEFVQGTAGDQFLALEFGDELLIPEIKRGNRYLLELDGVDLPMPISSHMILSIHNNRSGVLLILLSALASRNINVLDLQLGHRGQKAYAALGVEGDERIVAELLSKLGPQFHETAHLVLHNLGD